MPTKGTSSWCPIPNTPLTTVMLSINLESRTLARTGPFRGVQDSVFLLSRRAARVCFARETQIYRTDRGCQRQAFLLG